MNNSNDNDNSYHNDISNDNQGSKLGGAGSGGLP